MTARAMRKKRPPARYVRIDTGYGPAEHWETVKVVATRHVSKLFGDGMDEQLLVEHLGGARSWVAFWEEIPAADSKPIEEATA